MKFSDILVICSGYLRIFQHDEWKLPFDWFLRKPRESEENKLKEFLNLTFLCFWAQVSFVAK